MLTTCRSDLYFQLSSHAYLFEDEGDLEEETPKMNLYSAIGGLVGVTVVTSFCADNRASFLVELGDFIC